MLIPSSEAGAVAIFYSAFATFEPVIQLFCPFLRDPFCRGALCIKGNAALTYSVTCYCEMFSLKTPEMRMQFSSSDFPIIGQGRNPPFILHPSASETAYKWGLLARRAAASAATLCQLKLRWAERNLFSQNCTASCQAKRECLQPNPELSFCRHEGRY